MKGAERGSGGRRSRRRSPSRRDAAAVAATTAAAAAAAAVVSQLSRGSVALAEVNEVVRVLVEGRNVAGHRVGNWHVRERHDV